MKWHGSATRPRDFFRVETLVNCDSENEWIARGQASFQLSQLPVDAVISDGGMFGRFGVTFSARFVAKFPGPVRPYFLVTDTPFGDRFNAGADLRAAIR